MSEAPPPAAAEPVAIWDGPTRLFHWALVALLPAMWWTAEQGRIELHRQLGTVLLGLLLFRLIWGLIGSSTARFGGFVRGPRAIFAYLGKRAPARVGHNPLGAWSVVAMLALLAGQIGLGLFAADEDGLEAGPLAHLVDFDTARDIADLHGTLFNVLLALVALHIAAIVYYRLVRGQELVGPMLSGRGAAPPGAAPMEPAPWWRLALAILAATGLAWWIAGGA